MNKFAKLYETEVGQILVTIDSDADGEPCVSYQFTPENLGVCRVGIGFKDTAEGWDSADKHFSSVNEESALETVTAALKTTFKFK